MMLALFPLFLAAASAPQAAPPGTSAFDTVKHSREQAADKQTQADDVGFRKDESERMTVPVQVSGTNFRFIVDTGADRTAVSSAVAARVGLELGATATLHSMTGVSDVQTVTVPDLRLSRTSMRIIDAPVLEADHMGADGILGTDSLRSQRVIFDFEKKLMTIVPSEQKVGREEGTIIVTGRLRNGRLIVTDAIADGSRITVIVDTGSEVSVGNEELRRRLANRGQLKRSGEVELESVTGEMLAGQYNFVRKLEVGEVGLQNLAVVFADAHTFRRLGLTERPALLLGMNAFRAFRKVSIDFANRKLRVMLPETGDLGSVLMAARD